MERTNDIARLIEILAILRTPTRGCPWDLKQNFSSIAPYIIEEAYEVADAISLNDLEGLCEELGDLLFHIVFQARLAEERCAFTFADVVETISAKLIRRHPHIFGDSHNLTPEAVEALRQEIKIQEKEEKAKRQDRSQHQPDILSGVPTTLPALPRALKLQQKASNAGFSHDDPKVVLAKIREHADDIEATLDSGGKIIDETKVGKLLFVAINLARCLDVDPEGALRGTNQKFDRRIVSISRALAARGVSPREAEAADSHALWDAEE